ncbi:hypothetical protein A7A69_04230 [Acinetobacter sp. Ac_1271]|nr:hypothetical protein [Acinetobacter guerrae]
MNRKQKKEKRLRATFHTKHQACVTIPHKTEIKIPDWDTELFEVDKQSKHFVMMTKCIMWFVFVVSLLILIVKMWWRHG